MKYCKVNVTAQQINFSIKDFFCKCDQAQSAFTCSKLTIETLEQGVKYIQN